MKNLYTKKLAFLLLISISVITLTSQAKNYYVAANGADANTGLTPATAWKSISKVNASFTLLLAGDSILFRCGDTFYGAVLVTKSGSSVKPIVISSYGTGAKPVISGFTTVTGWTNDGGGIWHKNLPSATSNLAIVTINDKIQRLGRYPNADAANGGYLTYTALNSATPSITGPALSSTTNWTGAEMVVRKLHWIIDRCRVTSHSAGTLTYTNPAGTDNTYFGKVGYGYFFQDDIRTLDQLGEWFLNKSTKDLSMYFGTNDPSSYTIKVSTIDTLFNCGGYGIPSRSYITVDGLAFEGASQIGFIEYNGSNITVSNCSFNNNTDAINIYNTPNSLTDKNTITNTLNVGIRQNGVSTSPTIVQNNIVRNVGQYTGMGRSGDNTYSGIMQGGNTSTIDNNTVDSTGYVGIGFNGSNVNVTHNHVTNFCNVKDDGGGIYTWSNNGNTTYSNRVVSYNTVTGAIGAPLGTPAATIDADCIYMDGGANNVSILNNTLADAQYAGVFLNNAINITIRGNNMYNVQTGIAMNRMPGQQLLRNIAASSNIIYALKNNIFYWNAELNTPATVTIQQDMRNIFSVLDSNYYRNDIPAQFDWYEHLTAGGTFVDPAAQNFAQWQATIGMDSHSSIVATSTPMFLTNPTNVTAGESLSLTQYKDVKNATYAVTYALPAYSSVLLFQDKQRPSANAGADTTIILPSKTATLRGSGKDNDGVVSIYGWGQLSGPNTATITSATAASTGISNLITGAYKFILTVTDNDGLTGTDTMQVNVVPNMVPVANAGNDAILTLPANSIALNGTGTDADGTVSSYSWVKISGPSSGTIATAGAAATTANSLVQGVYKFELTVKDNIGAMGKDTIQVTVNPAPNIAPSGDAGADKLLSLPVNTVSLAGIATDTDGTISSYAWTKISGPSSGTIATASAAATTVNGLVQGVYKFELTVTDNSGAIAKDTVVITVNAAPVANAGIDKLISLPTNAITLAGNGTDTDGSVTGYSWVKISGPSTGVIATPAAAGTAVNSLVQGMYKFELTVTDNNGAIGKDTVQVTVNATPSSNAGVDKLISLPINTVTLTGNGTDADGTITGYSWVKISGPSTGTVATPVAAATLVSNLAQGIYKFELTVTDNNGATGKDTIQVTVNAAPAANAGADKLISLPTNTITLSGNATDTDGTVTGYSWVRIAGPSPATIATSNSSTTVVNGLVRGIYTFELTVTDNNAAVGKDSVTVTVNAAPVANAGIDKFINLPVNSTSFTGAATDADGTITNYNWIKISGPVTGTIATPAAAATSVNNLVQGIYKFELTAIDNNGAIAKDTVQVTVNAAPVASAGADKLVSLPNNTIVLTGSATDADGTVAGYGWAKISGPVSAIIASSSASTTAVNNLVQGVYTFELTATDNNGATGKDTIVITVNSAPVANAGIDKMISLPTNTIMLTGNATDTDGMIAGYNWVKISGPSSAIIVSSNAAATAVNNLTQGVYAFELTATDNNGATGKDTIIIMVNSSPVVNAGNDKLITLPANTITLTGSATDADGTIASYSWVKISGPLSATIASSNAAATAVNNLIQGVYAFELTATDNNGATGKDTILITVNSAPVASAGNDNLITFPANTTTLAGTGVDADGTITNYNWVKISGPSSAIIATSNGAATAVNNLVPGMYTFELTVTDNNGAMGKDTVVVMVNSAPAANAGNDNVITLPTNTVILNGSGLDSDGSVINYAWTKISGPSAGMIANPNMGSAAINGLAEGIYQYELTVTDNNGAIGKDTVQVTVNPAPNQLPIANAGTDNIITLPTNTTSLAGTGTDPDGSISNYNWVKIAGPSAGTIATNNLSTTLLNDLTEGIYQFELTVTDNNGAIGKDTVQITVNRAPNQLPVANAGTDKVIALPTNSLTLAGAGTDADGTVNSYAWVKISGPSSGSIVSPNAAATTLTSLAQGIYQYVLTVTDNNGATAKDTVQVTVNIAPNQPPVANAGTDILMNWPLNSTTLMGSGKDFDGTIAKYTWAKIDGPAAGTIVSVGSSATKINSLTPGTYQFELTVKDNLGLLGKDTVQVTVNKIPVANAGMDTVITLPVSVAVMTGSGTDDDGTISTYAWTKISGPANGKIITPDAAVTGLNSLAKGVYKFALTVKDNKGAIGKDTVQITVNAAPNQAPIVNAGVDKSITLPVNKITLAGTAADADGTISSYTWTKIAGPVQGTIATDKMPTTVLNNLSEGVYQFELSAADNIGAITKDTVQVTVNVALNQLPKANAGSDLVVVLPGNTTILNGAGTDTDGVVTGYSWAKISGPASATIATDTIAATALTDLTGGVYKFELTVMDNSGAVGKDTVIISVNAAPVANAGADIKLTWPVNSTTLMGSGKDADGVIAKYSWLQLAGPLSGTLLSPGSSATKVNSLLPGTYQFELTVKDNNGTTGKDTVQVLVNQPPVVNAGSDTIITLPLSNTILAGSAVDYDGAITSYAWSKISGPVSGKILTPNAATTVISSLIQGIYKFVLAATDNNGVLIKDTIQVTVNAALAARVAVNEKPAVTVAAAAPVAPVAQVVNELKVYPNPVRDVTNLNITTADNAKLHVLVTDMSGRLVKSGELPDPATTRNFKLDMSDLQDGYYVITVRFGNGEILHSKLLKYGGK